MTLKMEHFVHEAGHLVVGHVLGLSGQAVEYSPLSSEPLKAWFKRSDDSTTVKRSLAGLLAHLILMPETLEDRLVFAYNQSIIITPEHPSWHKLSDREREVLSGADIDMLLARESAGAHLRSKDEKQVTHYLQRVEPEVRALVQGHQDLIFCVAQGLGKWVKSEDRLKDFHFSADDAIRICQSSASISNQRGDRQNRL